jgi:regulator of replication initiation timing
VNNQIEIDDIKLLIGELMLENRVLQKELTRLKAELEEIKSGLLESRPPKKGERKLGVIDDSCS